MKRFLFFIIAFFIPALASAADYYVTKAGSGSTCSIGSPCLTINIGISKLASGDRLYVGPGTYDERLNNPPSGGGESTRTQIVATNGRGTVLVMPTTVSGTVLLGLTTQSYVTFDGIDFDATNNVSPDDSNTANGISLAAGTSNITFTNFELRNTGVATGATGNPGNGFGVGGNNHIFSNCSVHDNGKTRDAVWTAGAYAFYIGSGNGTTVDNCQIYRNGGYGIHAYSSPTNVTIKNSTFYQNSQVSVIQTAELIVTGSGHRVYNNVVRDGLKGGIQVFQSCTNCLIYNNTVTRNAWWGINLAGSISGATVKNNIFYNNNASGIGAANIEDYGSNTKLTNLCFGTGGTAGCNLIVDPVFVNAAANDFHLSPGSQAINTGDPNIASGVTIPVCTPSITTNCYTGSAPDIGAFEYIAPIAMVNQLVVALPLDEGSGTIAVDVSGQKNNATLLGGATWDNAGKYGQAVMLDGTGYLNIPPSQSLALAPGMTLEVWIYPTVAFTGLSALIVQDRYYLYAASDAGQCGAPTLAPLGGYSTTTAQHYLCATSSPSPNSWNHLAVTHDGLTTTFYLNGNVIASQASTDPMVPTAQNMTIGASQFGEYFTGKVDQPMVYNYSRTPAQIVSDMNTPLIGAPGKYVDIAAPMSVEISASSSLEISAD